MMMGARVKGWIGRDPNLSVWFHPLSMIFFPPTLFSRSKMESLITHTRYRSSTKIFHCDPNSFRFSCPFFFLNIYSVSSVINHLSEMTKQKWKFPVHVQVEGRKNTIFRKDSVPRGFRYRYSTEEAGCLLLLKKQNWVEWGAERGGISHTQKNIKKRWKCQGGW
jgi:hypothetical protein